MGDGQQESQAAVAAGSSSYQSMSTMQTPRDSLHSIPFEQQATLCEGTMPSSENADIIELNQMSPERNSKKAKYSTESEGCRRRNCKRSRCLKLWWSPGVTILHMRQQIEARNPLAFAPKVVKHTTISPVNMMEEGNWTIPSSSRHRKGCSCKKSKCSKKYCECFQKQFIEELKEGTIHLRSHGILQRLTVIVWLLQLL
uniref:CRC domain-containing protein n=1 Tax=Populus trichocarpa TaxID=3694 RepID=A0A3N7G5Z3_POPTR